MNKIEKNINRLSISTHDLDDCKRFLQELPHHEYGSTAYEALLIAATIFYTRPFSCNERDKNAKADSRVDDKVLQDLTIEELELHEKLLMLRNKALAHSEWTHHPNKLHENGIIQNMPFSIWKYFYPKDIEALSKLANKVWQKTHYLIANQTAQLRNQRP